MSGHTRHDARQTVINEDSPHAPLEGNVEIINSDIRDLAAQDNIALVDIEKAFGSNTNLIGLDGLHPTAASYQLIAQALRSVLDKPALMRIIGAN